jgi:hypothetical protein
MPIYICGEAGCRRLRGHSGPHNPYPTQAWSFLSDRDRKKLSKAGFATPRGGAKGAYQNHVNRNSKVIVPFEHLRGLNLEHFQDGYIIRLYPDQFFSGRHQIRPEFELSEIIIGENAFVLYRTHDQYRELPPLPEWEVRYLTRNGERVDNRGSGAIDHGHYVLRIATHGNSAEVIEGPPQGIFAPEYCNEESNFLSKCLLAWLITKTIDSNYVSTQGSWLAAILEFEGILDVDAFERRGLTRNGLSNCPLCLRQIRYSELHDPISFSEEDSLLNAGTQIINATRSTIVNLFHIQPVTYTDVCHNARNVAWGHATCNTKLGQRRCFSVAELEDVGIKIAAIRNGRIETFAWASNSYEMLRSPNGAVWIRINNDHLSGDE